MIVTRQFIRQAAKPGPDLQRAPPAAGQQPAQHAAFHKVFIIPALVFPEILLVAGTFIIAHRRGEFMSHGLLFAV